jgi:hypothetical protein
MNKTKNRTVELRLRKMRVMNPAYISYRASDSKCDVESHQGQFLCLECPFTECLHIAKERTGHGGERDR